jgi:hypothetical protein
VVLGSVLGGIVMSLAASHIHVADVGSTIHT